MTPFINSPEDVARLIAEADSWLHTRYAGDGAVKGTGASCAMLPWAILHNLGHKAPPPPSRRGMYNRNLLPMMETWLDSQSAFFEPIHAEEDPKPGDVLLYNAGIGHLALALLHPDIINSWAATGVGKSTTSNVQIADRLVGIWRPLNG